MIALEAKRRRLIDRVLSLSPQSTATLQPLASRPGGSNLYSDFQHHDRYSEFYASAYGSFIKRSASVGSISLLEVSQTAGDYSDGATADITIIRVLSRQRVHADLGAGNFSEWGHHGNFALNPPGFANSIVVDQAHRIDFACIPFATLVNLDPDGRLPADGHFGRAHAGQVRDPEMYAFFDRLWQIEQSEQTTRAEEAMLWMASRLMQWSGRTRRSLAVEKLAPRTLALAKERLATLDAANVTLAELAALCRLSPHHFCRAFKASTGLPPHRYQIILRMERARDLLTNSSLPVSEISVAVGYEDPAYFSRLFARETGKSPSSWRRERIL